MNGLPLQPGRDEEGLSSPGSHRVTGWAAISFSSRAASYSKLAVRSRDTDLHESWLISFARPASARSHVSRSLVVVHRGYELSNTANRRLALHARFFWGRRCPSGIPSARAFCLREPGVRLSALEMVLTGVLSLECRLSSFTSARVQSRRTIRFLLAIVLAISFSFFVRRL